MTEREELESLRQQQGPMTERQELNMLRQSQGAQSPTLSAMRFEPEVQPAVSTAVSPEVAPQPEMAGMQERKLGWGEAAQSVFGGLTHGMTFGMVKPWEKEFGDRPSYELMKWIGPYGAAAKGVGLAKTGLSKVPALAKLGERLPRAVKWATGLGATMGGAEAGLEAGKAVRGEEFDVGKVARAGITGYALGGVSGGIVGGVAKAMRKLKGPTPELAEKGADIIGDFEKYYKSIIAPAKLRPPAKLSQPEIDVIKKEAMAELGITKVRKIGGKQYRELVKGKTEQAIAKQTEAAGIAMRTTKAGKQVPAVRRSGVAVPREFADYKNFKDVRAGVGGGTKDITRAIQEIDGAKSIVEKEAMVGQAGPAERNVLWRTRDMMKQRMQWMTQQEARVVDASKGLSTKQKETARDLLYLMNRRMAYVAPEKLATGGPISRITKDIPTIKFAQEGRKIFEHWFKSENTMRVLRKQPLIKYREHYSPEQIGKQTLWSEAFGPKSDLKAFMQKPGLPDYVLPNKPFNPHALAREVGLPDYHLEKNLETLLANYMRTASKDIFNTSIIQNNKAFAQMLEEKGFRNSARLIQDWTAEAFGGVQPAIDRAVFGKAGRLGILGKRVMYSMRRALVRAVFPLNIKWNMFVQTTSGAFTYMRYGTRNSVLGAFDWFTNPALRKEIAENAYSYIVKTARYGKITQQDINQGINRASKLERTNFEKIGDAFNYFTEWTERHLTGWSIATARRHGIQHNLKGKALWEYASDGGAKTQSMYNLEDLPGILRSQVVKTGAPFQTFKFEVVNSMREWAGKTGVPPATTRNRIGWVLRFAAGVQVANYVGGQVAGRKPWQVESFIPFYNWLMLGPTAALKGEDLGRAATRGQPAPIGIVSEFMTGTRKYIQTGDPTKLRQAATKYLMPTGGGIQINRIVDGIIAISDGGVKDASGKMLFPITDTKDQIKAVYGGPWTTAGGQEYWKKREKSWLDVFKRKEVKSPTGRSRSRSRRRPGARR